MIDNILRTSLSVFFPYTLLILGLLVHEGFMWVLGTLIWVGFGLVSLALVRTDLVIKSAIGKMAENQTVVPTISLAIFLILLAKLSLVPLWYFMFIDGWIATVAASVFTNVAIVMVTVITLISSREKSS
ncbi:MAG: hypothetical protein WCY93_11255 [Anaerolineaceae bacterium]